MSPSISFAPETTTSHRRSSIYSAPQKKQTSITEIYFVAHSARGKLSREAAKADHDLRKLVLHANTLDNLMIDLANAEQQQERWFNQSKSSMTERVEVKHEDTIVEEPEWEAESESDSSDEEMEFDDEEDESLVLTKVPTRHEQPEVPALTHDDSDSEDELPSPPQQPIDTLSPEQITPLDTSLLYPSKDSDFLSSRHQPTIIAAY